MDSLWTPRNITAIDRSPMKQSIHQFDKKFFYASKFLASNAGKTLELKVTKKEYS